MSTEPVAIAIHGAAGRMGRRVVALAAEDPGLSIAAAVDHPDHPSQGRDAGLVAGVAELGIKIGTQFPQGVLTVIDFSLPAACIAVTRTCRERGWPLVVATTGLAEAEQQVILDAAGEIPVVSAPNMSLAVNLTMKLAELAAGTLADLQGGADVEILERHHRFKEDAPSGTALRFGQRIAARMGLTEHVHGRQGIVGKRSDHEIGYHAIRVGDNPGEHTVVFGMLGETIELTVRAGNRDGYALGALAAAKFVVMQPPGLYSMDDVLGL